MKLKTWQKILFIVFALLVFLRLVAKPAPEYPYYAKELNYPLIIAHQGGDGIWPGDTLFAYEKAVEIGADVLEMDAHITKEGEIVLMHDERVDRTTDGTGLIENLTLSELSKLDAAFQWSNDDGKTFPYRGQGIQVPTLRELFEKFPEKRYLIEIKLTKNPINKPLCDLIHEHSMQDKVVVASFHDDAMSLFREACPDIATSASKGEVLPFVLLGKILFSGWLSPEYQSLQVPYETSESYGIPVLTKRFIQEAHAKNVRVEPWTVDDPELMKQYIDWGVDGIITDRPDIMLEVLGR
ncbi:MAG TPA: glycerophosphodiester phosphodiesterase [Anaerolineales bacterium]|nr:glycerophosphodiester phosphodiesterase [Anaerolineales bacterium]